MCILFVLYYMLWFWNKYKIEKNWKIQTACCASPPGLDQGDNCRQIVQTVEQSYSIKLQNVEGFCCGPACPVTGWTNSVGLSRDTKVCRFTWDYRLDINDAYNTDGNNSRLPIFDTAQILFLWTPGKTSPKERL